MKFSPGVLLFSCAVLLALPGCTLSRRLEDDKAIATARSAAYQRASVQFNVAAFLKPSETWNDDLGAKLAPLLFHELEGNAAQGPVFLRLKGTASRVTVQPANPTLYFRKEKLHLKGAERDRALFLWFYQHRDNIVPQGVRITMDSDGHPALWEILHDSTGIYQIYVSQSLETLAGKEFGQPLSGRQSALEHPVNVAPNVVVSRVISDGPMAMGPAIYLEDEKRDVATLICRCMPPQVENIAKSGVYDVIELDDSTEALVKEALRQSKIPARNWLNEGAEEMDLRIRLPRSF